MGKVLLVYYSRTGYTRTVAGDLVAALEADVDRLDDGRDRSGIGGYLRCARDGVKKRTVDLLPTAYDPSRYDVVVIGTPVWAGYMSSPVRSYVAANRGRCKRVAFFCTQHASGAEKVFRELADICGQEPVATLAVNDREIARRAYDRPLERFVAAITGDRTFRDGPRDARAALLARRAVLEREIRAGAAKRKAERNGNVPDSAELAADDVARDVTLAEIDRDAAEIAAIDAALARLEAGTYGRCTQCGAPIAAARLAHHPEAARCLACQETHERRAAPRIARL